MVASWGCEIWGGLPAEKLLCESADEDDMGGGVLTVRIFGIFLFLGIVDLIFQFSGSLSVPFSISRRVEDITAPPTRMETEIGEGNMVHPDLLKSRFALMFPRFLIPTDAPLRKQ